jgi:hypothetical protein
MHRRGLVLLVGFLVAIVVAGGAGVTAPRLPDPGRPGTVASVPTVPDRAAPAQMRVRAE